MIQTLHVFGIASGCERLLKVSETKICNTNLTQIVIHFADLHAEIGK